MVIHTGQHYDDNMSDIFFRELKMDPPYRNLNIGSGTHAEITGKAMIELEKVMDQESPSAVIVYGDTNTTLSGALAAVKIGLPVVHVEAGPRTFIKDNPEEINRKLVDHLSTVLCCPNQESVDNLKREGITEGVYLTGDIMYETFRYCKSIQSEDVCTKYNVKRKEYVLLTWHRQENTTSPERMDRILDFLSSLEHKVLCPMHPRTKGMLKKFCLWEKAMAIKNLDIVEPVGYVDMVALMTDCLYVLCDSGGVSKEAHYAGVKCFFMLNFCPWQSLVRTGNIALLDFDSPDDIREKTRIANCMSQANFTVEMASHENMDTADRIVNILKNSMLI